MAQFKVIGSNRETGARMVLELNADSKAAAERKATQQGMSVNRVEDITDGHTAHAGVERGSGRKQLGLHPIVKTIILLVVVYLAYKFGWPIVRGMMQK